MEVVAFVVGALGLGYGAWSRWYLYRWARECRGTRISIAYKRKVKVDAPITEWMLWARQAAQDKEKAGSARMVFGASGTSVMIVQRVGAKAKRQLRRARKADASKGNADVGHDRASVDGGRRRNPGRQGVEAGDPQARA